MNIASAECCVVLFCDWKYLLPTVSTALSARSNISLPNVPIFIYLMDRDEQHALAASATLAEHGIEVSYRKISDFEKLSIGHKDRFLPPVALARFFIHQLLPSSVERFLYLDGDMFVAGSLDSLLSTEPPSLGAIVSPDNLQIFGDETSASTSRDERYFKAIGTERSRYFNSGMMFASVPAWTEISRRASDFLSRNRDICRSSDQSALNNCLSETALHVSQKYNYQTEHMMISDPRKKGSEVVIYHFTGGPKPWQSASWPWDNSFNQYFQMAQEVLAPIASMLEEPVAPQAQTDAGNRHRGKFKFRQNFMYPWRRITRRRKLRRLMEA